MRRLGLVKEQSEPGPKRPRGNTSGPELDAAAAPEPVSASTMEDQFFPMRLAPLVIEVFAGTAILSKICQRKGFRTLAIDCSSKCTVFPITRMDLTQEADLIRLLDIIDLERDHIELMHLAPPCGTASGKAFWLKVPNLGRGGFSTISVLVYRLERHGSLGLPFARRVAGAWGCPDDDGDSP